MSTPNFYELVKNKDAPSSNEGTDFYSLAKSKPKLKRLDKTSQLGVRAGIGAIEAAALPYEVATMPLASENAQHVEYRKNVFEDIERLMEQKQTGVWDEQDEQLLQSLTSQIKNPEEAKQFVKTADIGTGSLIEKGAEQLGYDIKPEGWDEHAAGFVGALRNPKQWVKFAKGAPKYIQKIASSEARKLAKNEANWKRLSVAAKGDPQKETLMKFAKDEGLSPEATNLLFQSNGKIEWLTKVGAKTNKFKGAIKELDEKLGKNYEKLKALGREGGYLDFQEAETLISDIEKLKSEMKNTLVEVPEMAVVEKSLQNAMNKGTTVETLINSRQALSKGINWKDIDRGDYFKKELKDTFTRAIEQKNPYVAEQLKKTDKAWSMYEKYKPVLDNKIPLIKFQGFEIPSKAIAPAILTYSTFLGPGFVAGAKAAAGIEAIRRMATRALIDPRFNKPFKRLRDSLTHGDKAGFKSAFIAIKNLAKEDDPELAQELESFEFD